MIAPARPTLKHRYPLIPIAGYAGWTEAEGALPASGSHVVPDALAPISVDRERDEVSYVAPGVWMLHA